MLLGNLKMMDQEGADINGAGAGNGGNEPTGQKIKIAGYETTVVKEGDSGQLAIPEALQGDDKKEARDKWLADSKEAIRVAALTNKAGFDNNKTLEEINRTKKNIEQLLAKGSSMFADKKFGSTFDHDAQFDEALRRELKVPGSADLDEIREADKEGYRKATVAATKKVAENYSAYQMQRNQFQGLMKQILSDNQDPNEFLAWCEDLGIQAPNANSYGKFLKEKTGGSQKITPFDFLLSLNPDKVTLAGAGSAGKPSQTTIEQAFRAIVGDKKNANDF